MNPDHYNTDKVWHVVLLILRIAYKTLLTVQSVQICLVQQTWSIVLLFDVKNRTQLHLYMALSSKKKGSVNVAFFSSSDNYQSNYLAFVYHSWIPISKVSASNSGLFFLIVFSKARSTVSTVSMGTQVSKNTPCATASLFNVLHCTRAS